ncbi:Sec23/Sec24 zinc finger [Ornithinibacillus halophilus]|uniref:Sec23/Sec24 zinc finger n=1 Tax=Ornithinibacillus halophilus TaxID=930117 RepID=A0A1M5JB25_9BACI|nr:Sec23/Sec24 zinc finger [Ornithinibacillus halophilus]
MNERFPDVDWYCDRCDSHLNNQSNFDDNKYLWKCTECGHKNSISSTNIYDSKKDYWSGNR